MLKKYKDEDGHPLDLVNPLAVKFGLPLSLYTYDENLRNQINSALYVGSASGNITAPGELTYEYAQGDVTVRKTSVRRHLRNFGRNRSHAERQAGAGVSHVAGGFRRSEHRAFLRFGEDRVHGQRQGGAAGGQEGEQRQYLARTL